MKIICHICNKEFHRKGFPMHLDGKHGMKFINYIVDYLDEFPGYNKCEICNKVTNGRFCSNKCKYNWMSTAYKDRNIWNEMSSEIKKIAKNKLSKYAASVKGRNIWAGMNIETKKAAKKKISIATTKRMKIKENNPMYGKTHSPETIQKIFSHRKMNKLEKIVADYLDSKNIEYYFQFFINDKSTHSYDFKIKNKNLILEIDGDYWHGGPSLKKYSPFLVETKKTDKIKEQLAQNKGYELFRFWESDLMKDITILNEVL